MENGICSKLLWAFIMSNGNNLGFLVKNILWNICHFLNYRNKFCREMHIFQSVSLVTKEKFQKLVGFLLVWNYNNIQIIFTHYNDVLYGTEFLWFFFFFDLYFLPMDFSFFQIYENYCKMSSNDLMYSTLTFYPIKLKKTQFLN